jgi:hypothetical protein
MDLWKLFIRPLDLIKLAIRNEDVFSKMERLAKMLAGLVAVATLLLAVITYRSESEVRKFTQKQQAWSIINDHAKDYKCDWDANLGNMPRYHRNSGQVEALQFLIGQDTNLSGIGMPCSEFGELRAQYAQLNDSNLWLSNFTDADFRHARLSRAIFNRSSMDEARFDDAFLENAQLHGVSARNAFFKSTHLRFARMAGSDFTCADFRGADLRGADFDRSQLSGASFEGAKMEGATFSGVCYIQVEKDACYRRVDSDGRPTGLSVALKKCPSNWARQPNDVD